jgi:preprotein translocase subunit YajC
LNFIALAQSAGGAPAGGGLISFAPFLLIIVIFYFLIIRPQQKKEKERKRMINELKTGDKVLTIGGMYGVITSIKEGNDVVTVKVSDNTKVDFVRSSIQNKVLPPSLDGKKKAKK